MATYKGIQGQSVQTFASDPSPTASAEGQLWFNSTSGTYKIAIASGGSWASGNSRNTAVQGSPGAGSSTSALAMGGNPTPGAVVANSETYDGTSWTETNNLNTARYNMAAAGTATAGLTFGGSDLVPPGKVDYTESWNGTCWSEVNDLLAGNLHMAECVGTQTAAMCITGSGNVTTNEFYNGTSWTELNDVNTGRSSLSGTGSSTAALIFGGSSNPPLRAYTESWNGTSWTEVNDLTNARESGGSAMLASNTTSLYFGGSSPAAPPGSKALTEAYNGTSWSEQSDLAVARSQQGGAGTGTAAIEFGGIVAGTPTITGDTEVWNSPVYSVKTVTVS